MSNFPQGNNRNAPAPKGDEPRINQQIRAPQIRLIAANGDMIGLSTVQEGLRLANEAGLDLVEISPNAAPPVCKVMDYGKFKYEVQKKQQEARKKQKTVTVKEVKIRPNIDKHDLDIKVKRLHDFLKEGHKVKITMMFRGREMDHTDIGFKLIRGVRDQLVEEGIVRIEQEPRLEGRNASMMVAPSTSK
jgi:translation initiation factor IF-3